MTQKLPTEPSSLRTAKFRSYQLSRSVSKNIEKKTFSSPTTLVHYTCSRTKESILAVSNYYLTLRFTVIFKCNHKYKFHFFSSY